MERTKLGLSKDKMYKAIGEGERTSKKVASIRMSDGSTFKRKNANQYGAAEGGNDYTEKRSNRTDRFDLGGTADSSNTGANMGGTMGSSIMKKGGGVGQVKAKAWIITEEGGLPKLKAYKTIMEAHNNVYKQGGHQINSLSRLKDFLSAKYDINNVEPYMYVKQMANGGGLKGKQKNLDLNKNGKLDSEDFKMIRGEMKHGGGTKSDYSDTFKQVENFGNEHYYIRKWGKVGTEKHDNMELLAVAKITDLEDYMPEEDLPKEGNFQLSISLIPIEKYIAKKHKKSANDEDSSMGSNTIINIDNYMGGLNYEPQEKVFFKTFEGAEKYLLSKELNDKISAQGVMSGFILDKRYNRAGQTNWDYLEYMTGERERFAQGGSTKGFEYTIGGL